MTVFRPSGAALDALAEGVAVDRQGNIYVGETVPGKTDSGMVTGHMVRKLVKN